MHKKISVGITASLVLIAVTITFTATMIFSMNKFDSMVTSSSQRREDTYNRVLEIDKIVRQYYYQDIDEEMLYNSLITGYVASLGDPESVFLTAEQIASRNQQSRGKIVSIGIEVSKNDMGYFVITKIYPESPADKVNMEPGDIITNIGDQDVYNLSQEEVQALLIGGIEGSKISLEFMRSGEEAKTTELTFATIDATSVESVLIGNVYYIKVRSLWDTAAAQFGQSLRDATNSYAKNDAKGLVIDLRDVNNGYNMGVVADMLAMMLPTGTLISGIYRGDDVKVLYTSDANQIDMPVVVLINENTKGYAEMFAAVMKDSDICVDVVGTTTAGSGTLKQLYYLTDRSGVYISVALLKPPKSGPFNGIGVLPISEVRAPDDFVLMSEPSVFEDIQFAKAVDILNSYS